jgi:hypothetical protein
MFSIYPNSDINAYKRFDAQKGKLKGSCEKVEIWPPSPYPLPQGERVKASLEQVQEV